jgi:predicted nucleic acid-binding protein
MIYLPDTNAFSAHLSRKSAALSARLKVAQQAGELRLSAMVMAEFARVPGLVVENWQTD